MSSSIFSDPNREKRIGNIMGSEIKDGQELGIITQAQNEIAGIAGEQRNNLAMQQQMAQNRMGQNQILQQAAGMMAMDAGVEAQVQGMNNSTQQLMQKYGIKPGADYKRLSQSYTSTASGSTTNYKTENVSNTKNEIHITQPQIVQGSQQNQGGQATQAKLKTWLDGVFAKQNTEAEIQEKEFRKREWSLNKAASKMMGRIESASKTFAEKMDPRKISKAMGSEFSFVLMSFAGMMLAKYWTPLLKKIDSFEAGVREFFGLPAANNGKGGTKKGKSFMTRIKEFLGAQDGESETLFGVLKGLVSNIVDRLTDGLKLMMEDRGKAMQKVIGNFKKQTKDKSYGLSDDLLGLSSLINDSMAFLGELGRAAFSGTSALADISATKARVQSKKKIIDITGSSPISLQEKDFDYNGRLKLDDKQTMVRSSILMENILTGKNKTHFSPLALASLFESYDHAITENGSVTMLFETAIRLLPGGYNKAKKFLLDLEKSGDAKATHVWVKAIDKKGAWERSQNISYEAQQNALKTAEAGSASAAAAGMSFVPYWGGNSDKYEVISEEEANKTKAGKKLAAIEFNRSGWEKFKRQVGLVDKNGKALRISEGDTDFLKTFSATTVSRRGSWTGKTSSAVWQENRNVSDVTNLRHQILDTKEDTDLRKHYKQKWEDFKNYEGVYKDKYPYLQKTRQNIAELSESAGNVIMDAVGSKDQRAFISKFRPLVEKKLKEKTGKASDEMVDTILGQWALESAWGTSPLALNENNFGGIKYASWMTNASKGNNGYAKFNSVDDFVNNEFEYYSRRQYLNEENLNKNAFLKQLKKTEYAEDPGYLTKVSAAIDSVSDLRGIRQTAFEQGERMVNSGKEVKQNANKKNEPLTQEEINTRYALAIRTGDFSGLKRDDIKPQKFGRSRYELQPVEMAQYLSDLYDNLDTVEEKNKFLDLIKKGNFSEALKDSNIGKQSPSSLRKLLLISDEVNPELEAYCRENYGCSSKVIRQHLRNIKSDYERSYSWFERKMATNSKNYYLNVARDFETTDGGYINTELEKRLGRKIGKKVKSSNAATQKAKEAEAESESSTAKANLVAATEIQNSTERQTAYMGDGLQAINANLAKINNTLFTYLPKNTSPGNANVAPAPEANPVAIAQ